MTVQRGGDNSGAALARARLYVAIKFCVVLVIFMSIFATVRNYPIPQILGLGSKPGQRAKTLAACYCESKIVADFLKSVWNYPTLPYCLHLSCSI